MSDDNELTARSIRAQCTLDEMEQLYEIARQTIRVLSQRIEDVLDDAAIDDGIVRVSALARMDEEYERTIRPLGPSRMPPALPFDDAEAEVQTLRLALDARHLIWTQDQQTITDLCARLDRAYALLTDIRMYLETRPARTPMIDRIVNQIIAQLDALP